MAGQWSNHPLVRSWQPPIWVGVAWNYATSVAAILLATDQYLDMKIGAKHLRWLHGEGFQLSFTFAVLGVVAIDSARRGYQRKRYRDEANQRLRLSHLLTNLLATLADGTHANAADLGAGIYLEQRHIGRKPTQLKRAVRLRLVDSYPESGITYVAGKGAVGTCWKKRHHQHHDWVAINRAHHDDLPDEVQWNRRVSKAAQRGFSYDEWCQLLGRYAEVIAVPITKDDDLIGVLAVDRAWDPEDTGTSTMFDTKDVRQAVGTMARLISEEL